MTTYVALLRAANLGPGSTLSMADLRRLCEEAGLQKSRTYIASGNVVFESSNGDSRVKTDLEMALREYAGKAVPVIVRTANELAAVLRANPFREAPGNKVQIIFLDVTPSKDVLDGVSGKTDDEAIVVGKREVYVRYGAAGIGRSRLKIPAAALGTARNINTVAKLVEMSRG